MIEFERFFLQIYLQGMAVACLIFDFYFFSALMNKRDIRLDLLRRLESNPECT